MTEHIVVGCDGSENSDRALDWAIQEAAALSAQLRVVVSTGRPVAVTPSPHGSFLEAVEEESGEVADRAVARAQERGISAVAVVGRGDAAQMLIEQSEAASRLVLGKRGRHGVRGRMGSVSAAAAAHAQCPVVVLPSRWRPEAQASRAGAHPFVGRVVVGVDRLGADNPAIVAAARYAQRHGRGLTLLTVVPEASTTSTGRWIWTGRSASSSWIRPRPWSITWPERYGPSTRSCRSKPLCSSGFLESSSCRPVVRPSSWWWAAAATAGSGDCSWVPCRRRCSTRVRAP